MSVVIDDVLPREQFIATSGQTVFNVSFSADADSDVKVYARATGVDADDAAQLVSSADYNVTFIGGSLTVRVTFLVGRTLDDIITITRETPDDRDNLYTNTNFTPSMLNGDFGRTVFISQQNKLYRQEICTRYNVSETIVNPKDIVLPILPAMNVWRMNAANTAIEAVLSTDITTFGNVDFYTKTDQTSLLPNSVPINSFASGFLSNTTGTGYTAARTMTGTANTITITNGDGVSGNPTITIADNPSLPGNEKVTLPTGTTGERPSSPTQGEMRFNSTTSLVEWYDGSDWISASSYTGIGTWTPAPAGQTTAGSPTGVFVGNWSRVNDMVTITAQMVFTSIGGAVGTLLVSGLPFPGTGLPRDRSAIAVSYRNHLINEFVIGGFVDGANLKFYNEESNNTELDIVNDVGDIAEIYFSISYRVA